MTTKANNILYKLAMILAVWFAIAGIAWSYSAALVIAYPFGLISLGIWARIRSDQNPRNKNILLVLAIGLGLSLTVLASFLIFD